MAKWISPLFSDVRNKLADSVVFSNWKGRTYFRGYVIPANPKTLKQQANRDVMRQLVARWKNIVDTEDKKAEWNKIALPLEITGYNLFVKYGRLSKISCPASASIDPTTGTVDITITYTLGNPAPFARIYKFDGANWTDITPAEGLTAGENQQMTYSENTAGTYYYFIADSRPLVSGDVAPKDYQAFSNWEPDITNGIAKEAKCVVS